MTHACPSRRSYDSTPTATGTAWFSSPPRGDTPTTKTVEKGRKHEDYRKNSSRGPAPARHPVHRADQQRLRFGRRLRPHLRGRLGRHPPGLVEISDAISPIPRRAPREHDAFHAEDRKSVVSGKRCSARVEQGDRRT